MTMILLRRHIAALNVFYGNTIIIIPSAKGDGVVIMNSTHYKNNIRENEVNEKNR